MSMGVAKLAGCKISMTDLSPFLDVGVTAFECSRHVQLQDVIEEMRHFMILACDLAAPPVIVEEQLVAAGSAFLST